MCLRNSRTRRMVMLAYEEHERSQRLLDMIVDSIAWIQDGCDRYRHSGFPQGMHMYL